MNLNQFLNMLTRLVMRRLVNSGISQGLRYARRWGGSKKPPTASADAQTRDARALEKRARQAAKITRRLGR